MITTVTNYGDSLGVQFPKSLWRNVHISENDNVEVLVKDDAILIKRQEGKKHFTTKERIAAFCDNATGNTKQNQLSEIDWGKLRGNEIW